ncbi:MAG: hypothetical protein PHZ26_02655 [Candidatus Gracilibacteria bacterium]|nr:hypothetical protein [Candidatus Gracilibacteria bacterium]
MINSQLLKLIKDYNILQEDAIEIIRIFEVMTDNKKLEILDSWPKIAAQIIKHREEIELEKEILLIKTLENIEKDIEEYNKSLVAKHTKSDIKKIRQKQNII